MNKTNVEVGVCGPDGVFKVLKPNDVQDYIEDFDKNWVRVIEIVFVFQ